MYRKLILLFAAFAFLLVDYIGDMALLTGLRKGYGLDQNSEIFVVGHSHMMMGVDKKELEEQLGCKISKYTRSGVTIDQRKMMTEQFLQSGNS